MKNYLLFVTFLLLSTSAALAQLPTNGLVAWYPFCGNPNDLSGNGYDLIDSNATLTTDRFGNSNAAYYFNGNNAILYYTSVLPMSGDMTFSCWFSADTAEDAEMVYNGNTNANGIGLNFGSGMAYVLGTKVYALAGGITYFLTHTVSTQQWHHAVLRRASGTFTLFVDTVNTGTSTQSFNPASGHFAIGKDYTNNTNSFKGKVDDVALYSRALSDSEIKQIFILGTSLATTFTNNNPVCGDTLKLTASAFPGTGVSYRWTGPNGFSSTLPNVNIPNFNSINAGVYTLTDTFQYGCNSTLNVTITLNLPAHSAGSNSAVCPGSTLVFSNSAAGATRYTWSGPAGFSSSLQNPQIFNVSASNAGLYYVTDTFASGCFTIDTIPVVVKTIPSHSVSVSTPVCAGQTLAFSNTASNAIYHWTGPFGFTSSQQNPQITNVSLSNSGSYYVTDTFFNGCTAKDTINVSVNSIPSHSASSNSPVCMGDTLKLNCTAASVNSFQWAGPGSYSSTQQNNQVASVNTLNSGNYYINYYFQNGCSATDVLQVFVNIMPSHILSSNSPLCLGDALIFNYSTGQAGNCHWTGPNNFSSTLQSPQITNINSSNVGEYYVTDSFPNGCRAHDSVNIIANPKPAKPIGSSNSPLCVGDTLKLFSTDITSGVSYHWTGPNSFGSNLQNPVKINAQPADSGIYIISAILGNCSATDTISVAVNAPAAPAVSITSIPTVVIAGRPATFHAHVSNCNGNLSYQWRNNGVNIIGATGSTLAFTALIGDNISVLIHCTAPCSAVDSGMSNQISVTTGINETSSNISDLTLFPNPNNGNFTLSGHVNNADHVSIDVVDAVGRVAYSTTINIQNYNLQKEIRVGQLAKGVYFVKLKTETGAGGILKFIIE